MRWCSCPATHKEKREIGLLPENRLDVRDEEEFKAGTHSGRVLDHKNAEDLWTQTTRRAWGGDVVERHGGSAGTRRGNVECGRGDGWAWC